MSTVTNWAGMTMLVGDYVWRGARDGNTSTFKIGQIESIKDGKPRVSWKYTQRGLWGGRELPPIAPEVGGRNWGLDLVVRLDSKGSPDTDSLVPIERQYVWEAERRAQAAEALRTLNYNHMTLDEAKAFIENYAPDGAERK